MLPLQPVSTGEDVINAGQPSWRGHLEILRLDHWFKNVFVLPGVAAAFSLVPAYEASELWLRVLLGLLSVGLVASSNYVINEVLDAPFDREHPTKRLRPAASGRIHLGWAYVQWLALMVAGVGLGWTLSAPFAATMVALWVMGCVYNIAPVRSKDLPYLDVLSEAVNNPLRMLAGWYLASSILIPPVSLLLSYWMVGCYFMAMKRFAEYRDIGDPVRAAAYRKSFAFYTDERLLVAVMFYAAAAMLFFGAFIVRYRIELIVSFPLVALVMSVYLASALKENSVVQRPEELYREPLIVLPIIVCALLMGALFFVDIPILHVIFRPTI